MKLDNRFALSVSIAIAASLTATMTQVSAEGDASKMAAPSKINTVNIKNSLSRTKLKTMSADSVLKLNQEGKINLSPAETAELNKLMKDDIKDKIGKVAQRTVMCAW